MISGDTRKHCLIFLGISILLLIIGITHKYFFNGVSSDYILFSFLIPLVFGCGVFLLLWFFKVKKIGFFTTSFYYSFVFSILTYSLCKGYLKIHGISIKSFDYFIFVSLILLIISLCLYVSDK